MHCTAVFLHKGEFIINESNLFPENEIISFYIDRSHSICKEQILAALEHAGQKSAKQTQEK